MDRTLRRENHQKNLSPSNELNTRHLHLTTPDKARYNNQSQFLYRIPRSRKRKREKALSSKLLIPAWRQFKRRKEKGRNLLLPSPFPRIVWHDEWNVREGMIRAACVQRDDVGAARFLESIVAFVPKIDFPPGNYLRRTGNGGKRLK